VVGTRENRIKGELTKKHHVALSLLIQKQKVSFNIFWHTTFDQILVTCTVYSLLFVYGLIKVLGEEN